MHKWVTRGKAALGQLYLEIANSPSVTCIEQSTTKHIAFDNFTSAPQVRRKGLMALVLIYECWEAEWGVGQGWCSIFSKISEFNLSLLTR